MTAWVGQSLRRLEDHRFLTGQGRYTGDVHRPGEAVLAVLRSPHAHAAIVAIDTARACACPGVVGVFVARDLAGLGPIPCTTVVKTQGPMHVPPRYALAEGRVRYVGEPVAFVVAGSAHEAADALEEIDVEYEPLACVVEAMDALAEGAPLVWADVPGNLAFRFRKGEAEAVRKALAGAAHVVALELVNNRVIVSPLEHRGGLAVGVAGDIGGGAVRILDRGFGMGTGGGAAEQHGGDQAGHRAAHGVSPRNRRATNTRS